MHFEMVFLPTWGELEKLNFSHESKIIMASLLSIMQAISCQPVTGSKIYSSVSQTFSMRDLVKLQTIVRSQPHTPITHSDTPMYHTTQPINTTMRIPTAAIVCNSRPLPKFGSAGESLEQWKTAAKDVNTPHNANTIIQTGFGSTPERRRA